MSPADDPAGWFRIVLLALLGTTVTVLLVVEDASGARHTTTMSLPGTAGPG